MAEPKWAPDLNGPRPPLQITVKCSTASDGLATFSGPDVVALFGEDASYFKAGKSYVVTFDPVSPSAAVGGHS